MKVFISYASENRAIAQEVELALRGGGHTVFLDRSILNAGGEYHARIRKSIAASDVFVYLVSATSNKLGRYNLSELEEAKIKWPNPWGHVLPVLLSPISKEQLDRYLTSTNILEPVGSVAAEVAAAVERLELKSRRPALTLIVIGLTCLIGLSWYFASKRLERSEIAHSASLPNSSTESSLGSALTGTQGMSKIPRERAPVRSDGPTASAEQPMLPRSSEQQSASPSEVFYGFRLPGEDRRVELSTNGFDAMALSRIYSDLSAAEHTAMDFSPTAVLTIFKSVKIDSSPDHCENELRVTLQFKLTGVGSDGSVAGVSKGSRCIGSDRTDDEMQALDDAANDLKLKIQE